MNENISNNEELQHLAKLGEKFRSHHVGKRPEAFHRYIYDIVNKMDKPITFKELLYVLDIESVRRQEDGDKASPLEKVDYLWQLITYHDPKKGRTQKTFKTLRNHLSKIKKHLFPDSPK